MANGKDPKTLAEKYVRRTTAAVSDMVNGVKNVTVNPAEQAIAKEQKLVANWNASVQDGKWRAGMRRVTLQSWQESMVTKGQARIASGVQAAQSKMEGFFTELIPYQDELNKKISTMNDTTLEDNIQRMAEWARGMSKFRRRGQ